jgi:hypothetical protein
VEPPEFGYEPEGARGETMAELEMAWPDQKVALTLAGNDPDHEAPPDPPLPGWRLFSIDTPAATILAAFQP